MDTFSVRGGQFRLNDVPIFLHAGEFHYFRTPVDQWEQRLGLLQRAGFNTLATYIPWLWHQPQVGVTDLDGHTHPLRDLAGFLDLAAQMGFWLIPRPGPYIMAETINEGVPPWVFEEHPQAAFIDQTGNAQNIVSYLHPDFLERVDDWYRAVFAVLTPRQITRGGRILMVQLDNEMGMIHWVRNIVDLNPDTLARFAAWLQQTHGDSLSARYPVEDLSAFLHAGLAAPTPEHAGVLPDYRRFFRAYLREYTEGLWSRARSHGMEVPPVINIHGFTNHLGGRTFPIGLSQLVEVMEMPGVISATDVYPLRIAEDNYTQIVLINEMTKALHNPDQALFSIEFQSGGNQDHSGVQSSMYDLHSRLSIACGMRAINHYLFTAGENDPVLSPIKRHDWGPPIRKDGTVRHHYPRYGKLSAALSAYGAALVEARPKTVCSIGFQIDDFMTEVTNTVTRPADDILAHYRHVALFDFIGRGLSLTHRPFDAVELPRAALDPVTRPVLWVALHDRCDAPVQQKLVDYARAGGRLILVGRLPETTRDGTPCSILREALGATVLRSDPPFVWTEFRAFDEVDVPASFLQTYAGAFETIFATHQSGETIGFIQRLGSGRVMLLGATFNVDVPEDLGIFERMATMMGCAPLFTLESWADIRLSEGANGSFLFINNYQDDPVSVRITAGESPLFGGHAVDLPARRGVILPIDWQARPGVVIHACTAEIRALRDEGKRLIIETDPAACFIELTVTDHRPAVGSSAERVGEGRFRIVTHDGRFTL
jgi:beta-galactosidase